MFLEFFQNKNQMSIYSWIKLLGNIADLKYSSKSINIFQESYNDHNLSLIDQERPSMVEICTVVLEKKIFKCCVCILTFQEGVFFHLNKFESSLEKAALGQGWLKLIGLSVKNISILSM